MWPIAIAIVAVVAVVVLTVVPVVLLIVAVPTWISFYFLLSQSKQAVPMAQHHDVCIHYIQ